MEQFIAFGLCKGAVYALVSLGFGLIYKTTRIFHIAHGAAYVLAAHVLFWTVVLLNLPLALGILLSCATTVLFGVLLEAFIYRPLNDRRASNTVAMISSLGAYIVLVNVLAILFGNESKTMATGPAGTVSIGGAILTWVQIAQLVTSLLLIATYWMFLKHTSLGKVSRSVADDAVLASVLGVDVGRVRYVALGLGSLLAAIGAILVALDIGLDPQIGFSVVLVAAVSCIIGGLHRLLAPALGGFLLGITQGIVGWRISAKWESAVTFAILIVFLLFRPQGLLGLQRRIAE
jgi:branched-chain amino acid transport system permease protein